MGNNKFLSNGRVLSVFGHDRDKIQISLRPPSLRVVGSSPALSAGSGGAITLRASRAIHFVSFFLWLTESLA